MDGCIRDIDALRGMDFPVYATGVTPNGPLKEGGGEINFPVVCGGLVVNPGDILVGDQDGIVVVSPGDAAGVLKKAATQNAGENRAMTAIENLAWDRAWVDAALEAKGCEYVD